MAADVRQPPRGSGDRIEWFTVSYRTLALAGGAIVLLGALAWFLFGPKTPPPPPTAASVEVGARFASIEGSVHVKRAGTLEWKAATLAVVLHQNDLVRTGSSATAEIVFADGMHISVRPDTLITIVESSQNPVSRQQRTALGRSSPGKRTSRPRPATAAPRSRRPRCARRRTATPPAISRWPGAARRTCASSGARARPRPAPARGSRSAPTRA